MADPSASITLEDQIVTATVTGDTIAVSVAIAAISSPTVWGTITGVLSNQTDLNSALAVKVNVTTTVNGHALSSNVTVSKTDVGLGNVFNGAQVLQSDYNAIGAILVGTGAGTFTALGPGSDGQILYSDSAQPTGVRWGDPP